MILIDALYINNSGGKFLLEYLIRELKKCQINCFFLLDYKLKPDLIDRGDNFLYLKSSLFNRYRFYNRNKTSFSKVFCFGNLGPPIPLNIETITYVHQKLFWSKSPKTNGLKHTLKTTLD